jgi:hypothetical protein
MEGVLGSYLADLHGKPPQTFFGNIYAHVSNIGGRVTSVNYVRGAVVVDRTTPDRFWWGMTTGN